MRILLIPSKSNYPSIMPSVDHVGQALPYLAAVLRADGHEVFGVNMEHQWCHPSAQATLERLLKKTIAAHQPYVIGLGGLSADYLFVRDAIRIIRKIAPSIPIICGGGLFTGDIDYIFPELRPDLAVVGEGERAIVELVKYLENGGDIDSILGIAYWRDSKPFYAPPRRPMPNLDELPFPDYSPFDFETYLTMLNQKDGYFHCRTRHNPRIMPVSAARSCAFNCTFCNHTTGRIYRVRSIDNVIKEIAHFYELYHFNILKLYDELFSINEERIRNFCQQLKELHLDIDWSCSLRVGDVNLDMLREMKDAGCIHVGYGFESASQVVLDSMKKKITVKQTRKAIELTEKAGIGVQGTFIFGDIAETPETIRETISFYNKYCRDFIVHTDYITPYPGSQIFDYCLENGIISDKKAYYESIHLRPRINMTKMSYKDFRGLIEPIVSTRLVGIRSSSVISCERQDSPEFDVGAPRLLRRTTYKVTTLCPHCNQTVDYLFPLGIGSTEPLLNICAKCYKRFVILPFDPATMVIGSGLQVKKVARSIARFLFKLRAARFVYNLLFKLSRAIFPRPL